MPVHYTPGPVLNRGLTGNPWSGVAAATPGDPGAFLPSNPQQVVGGGISGDTLKARDALLAQKRAAWDARPADQRAGFRTDEQGNRYWYQPGMTPEQEHNPVNSAWAYGLANPTGAYAVRQYAGQGSAPVRAIPTYTPPPAGGTPGAGDASPPLRSVVDSPSTHPYTAPPPTALPPNPPGETLPPSGTGGPIPMTPATMPGSAHPSVMPATAPATAMPRYFPIGQSTPGFGGASTPLQVAGMPGGGGQGQQPGGKPAGQPGFDPATAPTSAAAKQQGAAYQARQSTAQRQQQTKTALATPGGANPYNRRYTAANPYQPTPARY